MMILKGIQIEGNEETHQIDYEDAVANKPFGTTKETLFEWDGNTEGLECWEMTADGETVPYFYKVNDNTLQKESFIGATASVYTADDAEMTMEITEEHIVDGFMSLAGTEEKSFMVCEIGLVVLEEINIEANDELPYGINLTPGTWHASPTLTEGAYVKQIVKETVKMIDEKYIPESLKVSEKQKVPDMTNAESGAFLRVVDGAAVWQPLTDVSEVGA